eukprot:SAG31_NODE_27609_length_423_cov_0.799383_1_plen_110_part_01
MSLVVGDKRLSEKVASPAAADGVWQLVSCSSAPSRPNEAPTPVRSSLRLLLIEIRSTNSGRKTDLPTIGSASEIGTCAGGGRVGSMFCGAYSNCSTASVVLAVLLKPADE